MSVGSISSSQFGTGAAALPGQAIEEHLTDSFNQIAFQLHEHLHVHAKSCISFVNNSLCCCFVNRQFIHRLTVVSFEFFFIRNILEFIESTTFSLGKIHPPLGNSLKDLSAG